MKKEIITVGIIEFDFHADNLQELIEMFHLNYKSAYLKIDLVIKKDVFEIIKQSLTQYKNVNTHVYENELTHNQCLIRSQTIIKQCDVLFINTIAKNVKAFTRLKHKNIILRVHNSNKQFAPFNHIDWTVNWENMKLLAKFFLKEVVLNNYFGSLKKINRNVKYFAFSDYEMLEYAIKHYNVVTLDNSIYIPLKYYRIEKQPISKEVKPFLNISIIGRIDDETRDINLLTECLTKISKHSLQKGVTVKFIGTGRKDAMRRLELLLSKLSNSMLKFEYVYENVSQEIIINFIENSDLIISPLKINCKVGVFLEIYGKTKVSGNFSDIAITPQPVFLPADYIDNWSNEKHENANYINGNELVQKVLKCINDNKYLELLQEKAIAEAQRRYGSKTILEQLSKITLYG